MHADEPNIVAAIDRAIDECQAIAAEHATDRLVETSPDDVMTAAELAWDSKVVDSFAEIRRAHSSRRQTAKPPSSITSAGASSHSVFVRAGEREPPFSR